MALLVLKTKSVPSTATVGAQIQDLFHGSSVKLPMTPIPDSQYGLDRYFLGGCCIPGTRVAARVGPNSCQSSRLFAERII